MTLLLQSSLKSKTVSHSSSEFAPGEMRFFGSAENADVSPRAFAPIEVKLKDGLQAGLQLDFDLYAGGEFQAHQSLNGLVAGPENVDQSLVGAHLELLTAVLVLVHSAQNGDNLLLGGQRRPCAWR